MLKKAFTVIILSFVILLALGLGLRRLFAQRYYQEEPQESDIYEGQGPLEADVYEGQEFLAADVFEELEALGKKIDQALTLLQALDSKEILKKLDQILKEQELIKEELRIIKLRTVRR